MLNGNKKYAITLLSLLAALILLITMVGFKLANGIKRDTETKETTSAANANIKKENICDSVNSNKMWEIFGYEFKPVASTKSAVSGGLASQTCSYLSSDADSKRAVQLVVRYQNGEVSKPTITEAWQTTKNQNSANSKSVNLAKESFRVSGQPEMLYMFTGEYIISISGGNDYNRLLDAGRLFVNQL